MDLDGNLVTYMRLNKIDQKVGYRRSAATRPRFRGPMRHHCLTVAAVLLGTIAVGVALTAQDRVDLAMVARIRAEATERSKVLTPTSMKR